MIRIFFARGRSLLRGLRQVAVARGFLEVAVTAFRIREVGFPELAVVHFAYKRSLLLLPRRGLRRDSSVSIYRNVRACDMERSSLGH